MAGRISWGVAFQRTAPQRHVVAWKRTERRGGGANPKLRPDLPVSGVIGKPELNRFRRKHTLGGVPDANLFTRASLYEPSLDRINERREAREISCDVRLADTELTTN